MRNPLRLGVYLLYNPLFRKEVFKKQDMRFGMESPDPGAAAGAEN
jgi:hypothetical protein